jgi:putative membrane protein
VSDYAGFLGPAYLWVKAAHVTFVIFWLAGLFLLPRFYVYHQETAVGSPEDRAWIERENRVRSIILTPMIILVWVLGLMLAFNVGAWTQHWFHAKLALVVGLSAYQGWLGAYGRKLARGERPLSGKMVRIINEIPGVATVLIVILVIVRPF